MTAARPVPYDLPAERATLGAILLERDAILTIAPWLPSAAFYLDKHARIYEAMLACYHRREPPDLATVAAELRRRECLDLVGGLSYLSDLAAEVPTAVHIEYYARIVERTAVLRRLIEAGGRIAALGYDETAAESVDAVLARAEAELAAVRGQQRESGYTSLAQIVNELLARIASLQDRWVEGSGVPTGYPELDALTGGLQPSDLIIIGARPSQGKTSLALSLAYHVARGGAGVGIFSLEMSREQLGQRLLALHTGIDLQRIRMGTLGGDELPRAVTGMGELAALPIYVDDAASLSLGELAARARRMRAEQDIRLLILDYLQLLTAPGPRAEHRVHEVSAISRGLKGLARELRIPVIALSQLARAVDQRPNHVPLLSDFRESGSIEQDCDLALAIYREEAYDPATDRKGIAEIHILKHRNGPLSVIPLRFEARTTRFVSLGPAPRRGAGRDG